MILRLARHMPKFLMYILTRIVDSVMTSEEETPKNRSVAQERGFDYNQHALLDPD